MPTGTELEVLQRIGKEESEIDYRTLAAKAGFGSHTTKVICQSLDKAGYIDLLDLSRCVLTPKGREELRRRGLLNEEEIKEEPDGKRKLFQKPEEILKESSPQLPQIPKEAAPLEDVKLKALKALAESGGRLIGRNLASKLGYGYDSTHMDRLYRSLGREDYIDYLSSGVCVLAPKGRELLEKEGWIAKEDKTKEGKPLSPEEKKEKEARASLARAGPTISAMVKKEMAKESGGLKDKELLKRGETITLFPQPKASFPRQPQVPREKVALDDSELKVLRTLAESGGRLTGRNLASKLGHGYASVQMEHIYGSLAKEDYIDYLSSGVCLLTPKGRELLGKVGLMEWGAPVQLQEAQIAKEAVPMDDLKLRILKALANCGGRMAGRNLAVKVGHSNLDYMERVYRGLGKEDYINYLGSQVCVLTPKGRELLEKEGWIAKEDKAKEEKALSPEEKREKEARASLARIRPSILAEARKEMAEEVGVRRNPAIEALPQQMEAGEREERVKGLLLEEEEKRRKEEEEKESSMLQKLVRFMYRDDVFDNHRESWEFGEIKCFVDGTPDYGWALLVLLLEQSKVVLRWGWEKILGVYLAELDNQRNLQNYVRIPPDKIKEVNGLIEFLKEKGLGDELEEKIAECEAFQQQEKEKEEERRKKMKGPLKPLAKTEVDALEKIAKAPKGKIHYLLLGWDLGMHRSYSRVICNTLGKAEYIDFNMASGICEITPKGKLFLREKEKPREAREEVVEREGKGGWVMKQAEAIVKREMKEFEPVRHTGSPTGTELEALEAVAELGGKTHYQILARKMGRNSSYARLLCRSLGKGDYIDLAGSGICEITSKGKEELRRRGKLKEGSSGTGERTIPWQEELKRRGVLQG